MLVSLVNVSSCAHPLWNSTKPSALTKKLNPISNTRVKAFFSNPIGEPIVQKALQEPVAFMGGMFAGLLRLDMNDDPLKEWVTRTVEAAGITEEEVDAEESNPEQETPQQIEIECYELLEQNAKLAFS